MGFSPAELVYGKAMRGPLDLTHFGWIDSDRQKVKVSEWVENLQERLRAVWDLAKE